MRLAQRTCFGSAHRRLKAPAQALPVSSFAPWSPQDLSRIQSLRAGSSIASPLAIASPRRSSQIKSLCAGSSITRTRRSVTRGRAHRRSKASAQALRFERSLPESRQQIGSQIKSLCAGSSMRPDRLGVEQLKHIADQKPLRRLFDSSAPSRSPSSSHTSQIKSLCAGSSIDDLDAGHRRLCGIADQKPLRRLFDGPPETHIIPRRWAPLCERPPVSRPSPPSSASPSPTFLLVPD